MGGGEVARGKPASDLFLRAGEDLGVAATQCVVLKDWEAGIRAAAAGMIAVMVPDLVEQSPVVLELAAAVVGSPSEALGPCESWNPGAARDEQAASADAFRRGVA